MMNRWMLRGRGLLAAMVTCAAVLVMTTLAQAQSQTQAALDAVPAGSQVVILVPSMEGLSKKLAAFNDSLGLGLPMLSDALGEMKRSAGMLNGVNDQGAAVIVIPDINAVQADEASDRPMLVLVPVSDYDAFVANFKLHPAQGGVTPITMANGNEGFVRHAGVFAVLGPSEAHVKAYAPGNASAALVARAGKNGLSVMDRSDALMVLDLSAMAPTLLPKIQQGLRQAADELKENAEQLQAAAFNSTALMKLYEQAAESILTSVDLAVVGLDVTDLGIGLSDAYALKPGSSLAKHVAPAQTNAAMRLQVAADQPYLLAMAYNMDHFNINGLVDGFVGAMREANPSLGAFFEGVQPLLALTRGGATVHYPGQLSLAGGLFNTVNFVATDDPDAYATHFKEYLAKLNSMAIAVGTPQEPEEVRFHTRYQAGVTTVEGVSIDQYEIRYDLPPSVLSNLNPQLMMLAGISGQRGYVAKVGKHVIYTATQDLPTLSQAIAAAKSGKGLSSNQGVMQVREQLTPDAAFEGYLNLGTVASTVLNMAAAFGYPLDVQVPANLPPIGYSLSAGQDSVATRAFIPMPVIVFVKDTTLSLAPLFGGMMGGGDDEEGQTDDAPQGQSGGGAPPPPR